MGKKSYFATIKCIIYDFIALLSRLEIIGPEKARI